MWPHGTGSTLVQIMAWCLTASSPYLNQCLLIMSKVHWYSSEAISHEIPWSPITEISFKITYLKFYSDFSEANELTLHSMQSYSSQYSQQTPHSSPIWARYGASLASPTPCHSLDQCMIMAYSRQFEMLVASIGVPKLLSTQTTVVYFSDYTVSNVIRSHWPLGDVVITLNYRKISDIRRNKPQNLNDSHLVLQLSLPNLMKPGVKTRMKM